jgi:hypothetical protein
LEAYESGRDDGFTYVYDVAGRLNHMQDSEGNWLQKYEYNDHRKVIHYEYKLQGNKTEETYDYLENCTLNFARNNLIFTVVIGFYEKNKQGFMKGLYI